MSIETCAFTGVSIPYKWMVSSDDIFRYFYVTMDIQTEKDVELQKRIEQIINEYKAAKK
jgi:hypothetical protein